MMSEKVIAILNKDEKAKKLNTMFIEAAERQGLTGEELEKARESFLMLLISKNQEAMQVMAREAYEELNK